MMLFIATKSPFERTFPLADNTSHLLLTQDAVVAAALTDQRFTRDYASVSVLDEDLRSRGLSDRLQPGIHRIDYDRFVQLTLEHSPVISW